MQTEQKQVSNSADIKVATKIPLLDLTRFFKPRFERWAKMVGEVLASGKILNGVHKQAFEKEFAEYLGVKHVLGVASGTDALWLSLKALGVGTGDEVITHANAFIADLEAILTCGAKPVLVDMSASDFGPDPEAVRKAITPKTKAIMAVHLCGLASDMDPLLKIAEETRVPLVEDASQAQVAMYKGKRAGSMGRVNAFSFGPVKNLAAIGDAGCIATNDTELYEKLKIMVVHGQEKKYVHVLYGWNSRLDEIQAAWLRIGLEDLDTRNTRRQEIYQRFREAFKDLPIQMMLDDKNQTSVFHQAIILTPKKAELKAYLGEQGIETGYYYPQALHQQPAWKSVQFPEGIYQRAEKYGNENISLPVFAELTDEEVERIIKGVQTFFQQ